LHSIASLGLNKSTS